MGLPTGSLNSAMGALNGVSGLAANVGETVGDVAGGAINAKADLVGKGVEAASGALGSLGGFTGGNNGGSGKHLRGHPKHHHGFPGISSNGGSDFGIGSNGGANSGADIKLNGGSASDISSSSSIETWSV